MAHHLQEKFVMVCMIILFVTSQKPILNSETTYALSFYKSKTILDMSKLFGKEVQIVSLSGPSQAGGWGGFRPPPQFLAKQLTLSQPGGQIMPTTVIQAPPDFQTLRRPCILFAQLQIYALNARFLKVS